MLTARKPRVFMYAMILIAYLMTVSDRCVQAVCQAPKG